MKRERNCRDINLKLYNDLDDNYEYKDTRYWGLFYHGKNRELRIDVKRFTKITDTILTEKQLQIMQNRKTHYFYPKKKTYWDYNCNIFNRTIIEIEADWLGDAVYKLYKNLSEPNFYIEELNEAVTEINSGDGGYHGFIIKAIQSIEKGKAPTVGDDYNFQCGIIDYEEAEMNARMISWFKESAYLEKCALLKNSMYAQFFHQMVSKIEAVQIEVLSKNNIDVEHYSRDSLYGAGLKQGINIKNLGHHKYFERAYLIWNFLKHNSLSTYKKLKEKYPEVLIDKEFTSGDLAYMFIKFSDSLIAEIYGGCGQFFYEFCKVLWDEDEYEAKWNYNNFFEKIVNEKIEDIDNPLGLPPWI